MTTCLCLRRKCNQSASYFLSTYWMPIESILVFTVAWGIQKCVTITWLSWRKRRRCFIRWRSEVRSKIGLNDVSDRCYRSRLDCSLFHLFLFSDMLIHPFYQVYILTDWLKRDYIELIRSDSRMSDFTESINKIREIKTAHGWVRYFEFHTACLASYKRTNSFPKTVTQRSILSSGEKGGDSFLDSFNKLKGVKTDSMTSLNRQTVDPLQCYR